MNFGAAQSFRAELFWRGREVLARQHSIGFEPLGAAQQALFRFSNGFHSFVEPFEYEVVGPVTGPAQARQSADAMREVWRIAAAEEADSIEKVRQEFVAELVASKKRDAASKMTGPKRISLAQQEARLPDLHREEGPVAATVFIKGYDKPIVPTRPGLTPDDEMQLDFGMLLIAAGKSVFLCRDRVALRTVSDVNTLRDSFYRGWRLELERYEKPRLQSPDQLCDTEIPK